MEEAIQRVVEYLLSQGIPGVTIVALGWAVYKLYTRNQELHGTLYEVGRESVKANEATTAAINRLTDLLMQRNSARRS
jgi:ATP/maltotriose-dependent transcriptional regulator MalT